MTLTVTLPANAAHFTPALAASAAVPTATPPRTVATSRKHRGGIAARWDFKFKQFPIGAWWGPGATPAEMKLYRDAGFNVVMCGRYMQLDRYGDPDSAVREMDLAQRYGLSVLFDTYTKNDRPWGGVAGPTDSHPTHHPASLIELQWLYHRVGKHPALIGFLIGDDQGRVSDRAARCTQFLFDQPGPKLMPWLCGWIAPEDLAADNNPIEDPQIYPTLYNWDRPAETLARQYCASYAGLSRQCQQQGLLFWPMFNVSRDNHGDSSAPGYIPTDSLARFPAYAAIAYGAQGLWYFTYNGGALERPGVYRTAQEARAALTPLYPVARSVNRRIAAWGPKLAGRRSPGLFGTAFSPGPAWPFPAELESTSSPLALSDPGTGKLVRSMSADLIAGVLTRAGQPPLLMVVDCRVSKGFGDLPSRRVSVHFSSAVRAVRQVTTGQETAGPVARLALEAGGGQLLELKGRNLRPLCTTAAINATPNVPERQGDRPVSDVALAGIRQARLRIDVFGSDSQPPYNQKFVELNGHPIGRVPANDSDSWAVGVVQVRPEDLQWVRCSNAVVVRNEGGDAWKFRNLALAVQLKDGSWVRTSIDPTIHSSPHWAYTEGEPWPGSGTAGPIRLEFR